MIEISSLTVIKRDGELRTFDSREILGDILEAEKTLAPSLTIERRNRLERIVILIENEIYNHFEETLQVEEVQAIVEDLFTEFDEMKLVKQMRKNKVR